ncbi:signal peptidase I [Gynuella sunshinyii]|uniref:Signal peptidase I n=1 Tax=Gynuella sunshinyii YC6258 TaxID=1445510 RepID=A0A0C5VMG1_9GAMM|nr:signal peptidase I [Gynuella sunshinyii]AJQ94538.1 signal peptidase I [Gynuella sunshinyii YC6258]
MQVEFWFPIAAWFSAITGLAWMLEVMIMGSLRYRKAYAKVDAEISSGELKRIFSEPKYARFLGGIFIVSLVPLIFLAIRKSMDFSIFLSIACLISGILYLFDVLYLKRLRNKLASQLAEKYSSDDTIQGRANDEPLAIEYARSFFPVLLIVFGLRSFLIEPYQIPSGSMIPTLQIGDFIAVNKFAYGVKLPVLGTKIFPVGEPKRGDIFVFKPPHEPDMTYIKRVIAVPGDRIRFDYNKSRLWINDEEVTANYIGDDIEPDVGAPVRVFEEHIGDVTHLIYKFKYLDGKRPFGSYPRQGEEITVPEGKYFAMGDNRDNSKDSRFFGFVDEQAILGKAFVVWVHWPKLGSIPSFSHNKWLE